MKENSPIAMLYRIIASLLLLAASSSASANDTALFESDLFANPGLDEDSTFSSINSHIMGAYNFGYRHDKNKEHAYGYLDELEDEIRDTSIIMFGRAHYAREIGLLEEAEKLYRELLEREPSNPWVLNGLGYLLVDQQGREAEALELLERAIDLVPADHEEGYLVADSLAWAFYRNGRLEEADKAMEIALETSHWIDPQIMAHAGEIKWELGNEYHAAVLWRMGWEDGASEPLLQDAVRRYDLNMPTAKTYVLVSNPGDVGYWPAIDPEDEAFSMAVDLRKEQGAQAAYEHLQAFGSQNDLRSDTKIYLANLAYEAGLLDEAEKLYRDMIEVDTGSNSWILRNIGNLIVEGGRNLDSSPVLRRGVAIVRDDPLDGFGYDTNWNIGGSLKNALAAIDNGLAKRETELYNNLGYLLADSERDVPESFGMLRKALALDADNPVLLDSYGWVLYRAGDLENALSAIEKSMLEFEYALSDLEYELSYGDASTNRGNRYDLLLRELELLPHAYAEAFAHYGEVLWAAGRQDEARIAWRNGEEFWRSVFTRWQNVDIVGGDNRQSHPKLAEARRRHGA